MSAPVVGSLFSGYEGAGLALEQVWPGATVKWVSDIEPGPCRVLAYRFPGVPNLGDITTVDWSTVEPVDIITGGSPCQDLSHAGKRAGMKAGTRSGLWASMLEGIMALRPSLAIWENVGGAYSACASSDADSELGACPRCVDPSSGAGHAPWLRALGRVLGDLASIGFDACWTGISASDVGACHRRFRVFVLAWPTDSASIGRDWTRGTRSGGSRSGEWLLPGIANLLPTPAVNDMGAGKEPDAWDAWTDGMRSKHGNGNGHGKSLEIEAKRLPLLPSPQTSDTNGAGDKPGEWADRWQLRDIVLEKVRAVWGDYAPAILRHEQAFGRPAPSPTLPTGKGGKAQLSPRFEEWMMMLPDGWVADPAMWEGVKPSTARNAQVRLFGNGIVPAQMAEGIRRCLTIREAIT